MPILSLILFCACSATVRTYDPYGNLLGSCESDHSLFNRSGKCTGSADPIEQNGNKTVYHSADSIADTPTAYGLLFALYRADPKGAGDYIGTASDLKDLVRYVVAAKMSCDQDTPLHCSFNAEVPPQEKEFIHWFLSQNASQNAVKRDL